MRLSRFTYLGLAFLVAFSALFFYFSRLNTPAGRLRAQSRQLSKMREYTPPFAKFGGEWATCSEEQLLEWGRKNGIAHDKIELGSFKFEHSGIMSEFWMDRIAERRGMKAKSAISAGEVIVSMPFKTLISSETAKLVPQLKRLVEAEKDTLEDLDMIILFVLHEMNNEKSPWAPVICKFPKVYENALYWTKEDLKRIQETATEREEIRPLDTETVRGMAMNFRYQVVHLYNTFFPRLPQLYPEAFVGGKAPALEDFVYAAVSVFSRNWMVTRNNTHHNIMGPVADMVNHRTDDYGYIESDSDGNFIMYAGRAYKPGEEVFTNYGPKCNEELLVNYGFADMMNTIDCEKSKRLLAQARARDQQANGENATSSVIE